MTLHDRLGLARRTAAEQPDRGVVLVRGEDRVLVRECREPLPMALASDPDELRSMVRVLETRSELGQHFDAYQRNACACVVVEGADLVGFQVGVHHDHHRPEAHDTEERADVVRPVG